MHFPPALLPTIFALPLASAHFLLQYPATAGFNDNQEGTAPCGSFTPFTPGSANITDFHVGGDAVAVTSTHPAALWLFRAALGTDMAAANWTQLVPTVGQTGLGNFCERQLVAPASWAGQKGIVQVVQDNAADGVLYQVRDSDSPCGSFFLWSLCYLHQRQRLDAGNLQLCYAVHQICPLLLTH